MKLTLGIFLLLFGAGCATREPPASSADASRDEAYFRDGFSSLPADAHRVVEKLAACNHFAGEFGGDRSTRDREVGAAMTQLHCETIDADVRRIVQKYPGNRELIRALKAATEL
jgi:hypothetical protein